MLIDYSGGTGILVDRLLLRLADRQVGAMIVDSSPKFLRVALDRFRDNERVAFRVLRYLKGEKRLELLDEVVDPVLVERGVDAITSTNAIHLYPESAVELVRTDPTYERGQSFECGAIVP